MLCGQFGHIEKDGILHKSNIYFLFMCSFILTPTVKPGNKKEGETNLFKVHNVLVDLLRSFTFST